MPADLLAELAHRGALSIDVAHLPDRLRVEYARAALRAAGWDGGPAPVAPALPAPAVPEALEQELEHTDDDAGGLDHLFRQGLEEQDD